MNTSPAHSRASARVLAALLCGLALPALSRAQTSGTWTSTTGGNWSDPANWSRGIVATGGNTTKNVTATFSATGAQTINLDANETVRALVFSGRAYTLSSTNGSVLTLAGTGAPVIASSGTISATLAGTQGFRMNPGGQRTLYLTGNNTYAGATTIAQGGKLYVGSNHALGASGPGNGTVISYANDSAVQLHFYNSVSTPEDITVQLTSGNSASKTSGAPLIYTENGTGGAHDNITLGGNITLDRNAAGDACTDTVGILVGSYSSLSVNGDIAGAATGAQASGSLADPTRLHIVPSATTSTATINGVISDGTLSASTGAVNGGSNGGLSLYTSGVGTVTLTAANTYTGGTVVGGTGTLRLAGSGSIANSMIYNIAAGARLDASGLAAPGYSLANVATTLGVGATKSGFINVGAGTLTLGGASSLTLNFTSAPTAATFRLYTAGGKVNGDFTSVSVTGSLGFGSLALADGTRIWSGAIGRYNLSFNESTGILTVAASIPEPDTYAALPVDANPAGRP